MGEAVIAARDPVDLTVGVADRHDRTRRHLGGRACERLRSSRVLLVGAGAIGNEIAKNLALLGVGRLDVVDFDIVSPSNLNRCPLFTTAQATARTPKVEAVAAALAATAPDVEVVPRRARIEDCPEDVRRSDLVAVAVDDNAARYHINAVLLGLDAPPPVVDTAMGRAFCQVQILHPPDTACLVCLWSPGYHERLMEDLVRESCDEFFERNVEAFPALPVVSSMAGALAATEILALLTGGAGGIEARPGRALRFDMARREVFEGEVLRNPGCVEVLCRRGGGE